MIGFRTFSILLLLIAETGSAFGQAATFPEPLEELADPFEQVSAELSDPLESVFTRLETLEARQNAQSLETVLYRLEQLEARQAPRQVYTAREGWIASAGIRIVEPRGTHFPVILTGNPSPSTYSFEFDYSASPFVEVEWIKRGGFGIRASYWHIESEGRAQPDNAGDPLFRLSLITDVVDLEATQDVDFGFISVIYTGGIRYLSSTRETGLANINLRTPDFEGIGPTVSYEVRRRFNNWSLFHSLRAGLLYGNETHTLIAPGNIPNPVDHDGFIPVGDLEVGIEAHELFGQPLTARASWFGTAYRDIAYLGLHLELILSY